MLTKLNETIIFFFFLEGEGQIIYNLYKPLVYKVQYRLNALSSI